MSEAVRSGSGAQTSGVNESPELMACHSLSCIASSDTISAIQSLLITNRRSIGQN